MTIKPMTPQQLYDSLVGVLGAQDETRAERRQAAKKGARDDAARPRSSTSSGPAKGPIRPTTATGIPQVLRLMNSPQMNRAGSLRRRAGQVGPHAGPERRAALPRHALPAADPGGDRAPGRVRRRSENQDAREAYTDLLWVLLNSSEFALNH